MGVLSCDRFVDQSLAEELMCSLCLHVLTNAVDTQCRHTYCYECLNKCVNNATSEEPKCPNCRHRLTADWRNNVAIDANQVVLIGDRVLVDKNRKVNAMVAKLKIRCDYECYGCREECPLESLTTHKQCCPYRLCETCDLSLAGQTTPDGHNCLDELKRACNKWEAKCGSLESDLERSRSIAHEWLEVIPTCRNLFLDMREVQRDDNTGFSELINDRLASAWKAINRAMYVIAIGGNHQQFEQYYNQYHYLFDNRVTD